MLWRREQWCALRRAVDSWWLMSLHDNSLLLLFP